METFVKVGLGMGAAAVVLGGGYLLYTHLSKPAPAALPPGAPGAAPRLPGGQSLPGARTTLSTPEGAPLYLKGVTLYTADGQVYPTGKTRLVRTADGLDVYIDERGVVRLRNGIQMITDGRSLAQMLTPLGSSSPAPAPGPAAPPSGPPGSGIIQSATDIYGQASSVYEQGKGVLDKGKGLLEGLGGGGGGGTASADLSAKFSATVSGAAPSWERARSAAYARMYARRYGGRTVI